MDEQKPKRDLLLPASILIAALMVTIGLIYNTGKETENQAAGPAGTDVPAFSPENVKPVSSSDHILGNPNAPVKVIEFSDLECPFCKNFHATMHQVVRAFGDQVAWTYRHFPLDKPDPYGRVLHSKAGKEAQAAECAAKLGGPPGSEAGNEKFWAFVDKIFEVTPSNNGLDLSKLPSYASQVGLNQSDFKSCLDADYGKDIVESQYQDGLNAGAEGTPYSIVVNESGKKFVIPGALPFDQVSAIINSALK